MVWSPACSRTYVFGILSSHVQMLVETVHVEVIEFSHMTPLDGPSFTGIEKSVQINSIIYLALGVQAETSG